MEVRRMAHAKAKAKGLPCLSEPIKTVDTVMTIATMTVKVTIVKTMIANTVAMIGVNPLMIENM